MLAEHGQHAHACSTHRAGSLLEHSVHCMLGPSGQPPHPNAHIVRDCTQAGAPACMCAQPHGVAVIDCATLLLAVVPTAPPNLLSCWLCTASSLRKHPTGRTAHVTPRDARLPPWTATELPTRHLCHSTPRRLQRPRRALSARGGSARASASEPPSCLTCAAIIMTTLPLPRKRQLMPIPAPVRAISNSDARIDTTTLSVPAPPLSPSAARHAY